MGDITCAVCGEPWEAYYVYHEMTEDEKEKFLNGEGCPCCPPEASLSKEEALERKMKFIKTALDDSEEPDKLLDRWGL